MSFSKFYMKVRELSEKTIEELGNLLNEKRIALGKLKFTLSTKQLKNVKKISEIKKDIARILTIKNIKLKVKS